ncbi:MAG: GAF domain-containing protein [Burkholderiales bacterium]|nr:GAF domain-containing protein [Burkholderiales bacterium]
MHDAGLLMNLFKMLNEGKLDMAKFQQMLTRAVVQENAASRAGIWFYYGDLQDTLTCTSLYDASDNQWTSGDSLHEDDHHAYFETLRESRVIVAADARENAATSCFNENYLEPLNIYSRMDVVVEVDGAQMGVISCEQTAQIREWTQPDLQFLQQAAAALGLAIKKCGI